MGGRNRTVASQIDNQKIEINKNHLESKHPLFVAKTIIHEAIHAFLKLKAYECNNDMTLEELDNQELDDLLSNFNYDCLTDTADEHDVMFNKLIPNMVSMLEDVMNDLVATEDLDYFYNFYPNNDGVELEGCLFYMCLTGLEGASTFNTEISNNSRHNYLFQGYIELINNELQYVEQFNFETCED
jgi:hypothetical protein